MSYGSWWVEFEASGFKGKMSDVIFDMEGLGEISDCFWFEGNEDTQTISITNASDELWGISDEALEDALDRLYNVHGATITGYVLTEPDSGVRTRGEWDNDKGYVTYGQGIDPAEYTVDQLNKIKEYAEKLKEE